MPQLSKQIVQRNLKFLSERKSQYRFACNTIIAYPKPHHVDEDDYGRFIAVPLITHRVWRFTSKAKRDSFKRNYMEYTI